MQLSPRCWFQITHLTSFSVNDAAMLLNNIGLNFQFCLIRQNVIIILVIKMFLLVKERLIVYCLIAHSARLMFTTKAALYKSTVVITIIIAVA